MVLLSKILQVYFKVAFFFFNSNYLPARHQEWRVCRLIRSFRSFQVVLTQIVRGLNFNFDWKQHPLLELEILLETEILLKIKDSLKSWNNSEKNITREANAAFFFFLFILCTLIVGFEVCVCGGGASLCCQKTGLGPGHNTTGRYKAT